MTRELIIECMTCKEECEEEDSCFECAERQLSEYERKLRKETRLNVLEEIQNKMISLHTDMIFRYGVDIIEGRADAFGELKDWLKEQIE